MADAAIRSFMRLARGGEGPALLANVLGGQGCAELIGAALEALSMAATTESREAHSFLATALRHEGCLELRNAAQAAMTLAELPDSRRDPRTDPQVGDVIRMGASDYTRFRRVVLRLGDYVTYAGGSGPRQRSDIKGRRTKLSNWIKACAVADVFRHADDPEVCDGVSRSSSGGLTCSQERGLKKRLVAAYTEASSEPAPGWYFRQIRIGRHAPCESCAANEKAGVPVVPVDLADMNSDLAELVETSLLEIRVALRKSSWRSDGGPARAEGVIARMRETLGLDSTSV